MTNKEKHINPSDEKNKLRESFVEIVNNKPFDNDEFYSNLPIFTRASVMAKFLFLEEMYKKIKSIPGDIFIFGVYLGFDFISFENLRAIHEPYNRVRNIIGFDTFNGYAGKSAKETLSKTLNSYKTPNDYQNYLQSIMDYHLIENQSPKTLKHRLIVGDVTKTLKVFLRKNPEKIISLAYFDLAIHKPTISSLKAIEDRLIPGSIVIFDELNDKKYPGESEAFLEWVKNKKYEVKISKYLPDRSYVTIL